MDGAFDILRNPLVYLTVIWLLASHASSKASKEPKAHVMPNVTVEWGSELTIPCSGETLENTNVYWSNNGKSYLRLFNGNISYGKANPDSVVLNDDGSLTLTADYTSVGEYECAYKLKLAKSYTKTQTTVNVTEPPLRVSECNSTSDANNSCQVKVPNGTETLTFTSIKAGSKQSNGSLTLVNPPGIHVVSETHNTSWNDDNSTTISALYLIDVRGLTSSSTLPFLFHGETKEEFIVELIKAEPFQDNERPVAGTSAGISAGIAVGVIVLIVIIIVVIVLVRKQVR